MLLTLYYMASTCIQSWRLNFMKNKFLHLFSKNSSVVLYKEKILFDLESNGNYESLGTQLRGVTSDYCINKTNAHLLDLWCYKYEKRGCSVVPVQNINISNWISISGKNTYFPIRLQNDNKISLNQNKFSLLLEISFSFFNKISSNVFYQLESYGVPKAWTANEYLAIILETDIDNLTKLATEFMLNELYLNNIMEIIRLETVCIFGTPCDLLYADRIPILIYSLDDNCNEKLNNSCISGEFHVQILTKIAKCAEELQKSSEHSLELDYPPVTLVKNNFKKMSEASVDEIISYMSDKLDITKYSKPGHSRSDSENVSASILMRPDSTAYSLDTNSYHKSEIILESLMNSRYNSVDKLDCKKCSNTTLYTAETTSIKSEKKNSAIFHHRGEQKTGKPPNILVFSESPSSVENIKNSLNAVLRKHRYTVYSLTLNEMLHSPWMQQAALVVVCGNVPLALQPFMFSYLLNNGGQLLCLCSDLLGIFLPTFKTAEVRPNEVVSFSYEQWNHITLLHHIFCYQPSPKTSKFSMDESPSNITETSHVPATVELIDPRNNPHKLQVKVLASEETWQTPILLLASKAEDGGKVLFSQVHLEVDPCINNTSVSYNPKLRLSLLSNLLNTYLGLECDTSEKDITYTCAYFLGRHEKKLEFLKSISSRLKKDNILEMKNVTLKFCGKGESATDATDHFLPVMMFDCPSNFSTVEYFENLKTEHLGRLVIYSEIMTSSMHILNGTVLEHGFVAISRQQTAGVGRGGNAWISPDGCAMFSLQLHIPLSSPLGERLSLLQHIIALSIVSAVRSQSGYEDICLGLKWPNDIYAGGMAKVGGLIITSSIIENVAICNAGCALNLNNSLPTTCVNDMIAEINEETNQKLPKLSLEKYFACVFSQLEILLNIVQSGSINIIFDLYYKYWLHNFAQVKIVNADNFSQIATIVGVDDYGFLKVRGENGDIFTVQPDGNSFDMLSGLIAPK